ncbi:MAG: hypothetical protein R3A52_07535 [Polyangiales bacterium]
MDDDLRLKIAASLDAVADAPMDPAVARALESDPDAVAYARELRAIESALTRWPTPERAAAEWDARAEALLAALGPEPKGRRRSGVEARDPLAFPTFDDENPMESQPAMSEPNDHDPDLDNLTALTRTSLGPGAIPSTPPRSLGGSITDDIDDTSSGLVDIKQLAEMARKEAEAEAAKPAPATREVPKTQPIAQAEIEKKIEAKSTKKDDVMVTPARAASPTVAEPPPKRANTGPLWALGGVALTAGAFFLFNGTRSESPTTPAMNAETPAATAPATPEATTAPAPTPSAEPSAAAPEPAPAAPAEAAPESAPTPAPVVAAPPPAAPEPAPTPAREEARARAHHTTTTAAAPTPPPPPRAEPRPEPHAAREAPRAAPATTQAAPAAPAAPSRPAASTGAAGGGEGRPQSIDELMGRVAPGARPAAPAAAAPAAQPDLPERLNRSAITGTLAPLNGAVRACAQGQTGTAPVNITIGNDGNVRNAALSGQFAGTPVGECITGVVRRAHFPQFRNPTQTVMYPFVILPPGPGGR